MSDFTDSYSPFREDWGFLSTNAVDIVSRLRIVLSLSNRIMTTLLEGKLKAPKRFNLTLCPVYLESWTIEWMHWHNYPVELPLAQSETRRLSSKFRGVTMEDSIPKDARARGLAFVRRNGSELMKALAAHGSGLASGDDVLPHLRTYQNDDGGWERFDGDMQGAISTISQTWVGLQWLLWTRPSDSVPLDRTLEFLSHRQHDEGY